MARSIANGSQRAPRIRNCAWGYKCEKNWDGLIATDDSNIRFCDACAKEVYLCRTEQELASSVLMNRCVAFPANLLHGRDADSSRSTVSEDEKNDESDLAAVMMIGDVGLEYFVK